MEQSLDQSRNIGRARDNDWRADLPWHSYLKRAVIKALLWGPNELFRRSVDWDRRPAILGDAASVCPALNLLEQNFAILQAEYRNALRDIEASPRYHEVDPRQRGLSDPDEVRSWRVFFLEALGRKIEVNRKKLPEMSRLLDQIPNLFQAQLSRLEPGKSVPVHASPYNGYLRYHLALEVPRANPPYMIIGGQKLHWIEGKGVLIDDTYDHEVINKCSEPRTVLIVDIDRPTNFAGRMGTSIVNFILNQTYARWVCKNVEGALTAN
jgi:aspartyl/asparaginyl beta-hydroxylase (cupin superfamily)